MTASDSLTRWNELQRLAAGVLERGDDAYDPLWLALAPELEKLLASGSFLGRLSQNPEWQRDVLVLVWEKLADRDFSKLRAFFKRESERATSGRAPTTTQPFRAWMRLVVKNIGIDYLRTLPEYIRHRKRTSTEPTREPSVVKHWHSIATLHDDALAARDPVTVEGTARQMLEFLDASIPARLRRAVDLYEAFADLSTIAAALGLRHDADAERALCRGQDRLAYRPAIELWSQGYGDREIADLLGLSDDKHARRVVNAAKELLRRHFRK